MIYKAFFSYPQLYYLSLAFIVYICYDRYRWDRNHLYYKNKIKAKMSKININWILLVNGEVFGVYEYYRNAELNYNVELKKGNAVELILPEQLKEMIKATI